MSEYPQLLAPLPLSADGTPPAEWCIFQAGDNPTTKGVFRFTAQSAKTVMAEYLGRGILKHGDYNHASLVPPEKLTPESGRASCRYELEVRASSAGLELWAAKVKWTSVAAKYINDREYFHTSAAFRHDDKGEILTFVNLALTNDPATLNQPALVAASAASVTAPAPIPSPSATATQETAMKIKMNEQLRTRLAAAMDGEYDDDEQCTAALRTALGFGEEKKDEEMKATAAQLTALTGKAKPTESIGVLTAWKESHAQVAELTARLGRIEQEGIARDFDTAVEGGRKDCKLSPAQVEKWIPALRKAGKDGLSQLTSFLEVAPKLVNGQVIEPPAGGVLTALTAVEKEVARATGTSEKEFLEAKKQRLGVA